MHVLAIANQKGGVGKTTTAVHLAAGLALQGKRVLLLDLDAQANATSWLGADGGKALYEWLAGGGESPFVDVVQPTAIDGLDLAPSSSWLHGIEAALRNEIGPETLVREGLGQLPIDAYDFVVLDTAPGLGILTVNALAAADSLLVPVAAHVMSLAGLAQLLQTVTKVRERLNPGLGAPLVLACRVDARTNHSKEVQGELKRRFGRSVLSTYVRENVRVAEAFSHGQTVFDYAQQSTSAEDYYALAEEVAAATKKKRAKAKR